MNSSNATSVMNRLSSMQGNRRPLLSGEVTQFVTPSVENEESRRESELLPELTQTPDHTKVINILSGGGEMLNSPMLTTDFRPKDMSLRRS